MQAGEARCGCRSNISNLASAYTAPARHPQYKARHAQQKACMRSIQHGMRSTSGHLHLQYSIQLAKTRRAEHARAAAALHQHRRKSRSTRTQTPDVHARQVALIYGAPPHMPAARYMPTTAPSTLSAPRRFPAGSAQCLTAREPNFYPRSPHSLSSLMSHCTITAGQLWGTVQGLRCRGIRVHGLGFRGYAFVHAKARACSQHTGDALKRV